jgi:hypothetical protein
VRRRVLHVEAESRYCHRLSGSDVKGLVMTVNGGKVPVWSPIAKAFTVSERTAANVVALAESRNYDIVITGPRAVAAQRPASSPPETVPAPSESALW